MQPNQSPYDFILSSGQPQKSPVVSKGPNSTLGRALVFGGILFVVLIVVIILFSVLGNDGGAKESLLKVMQTQQETVRVAEAIHTDTTSQTIKNLAINTSVGVSSDLQTLTAAAGSAGIGFSEELLLLGQNPDTDTILANAKAAGTYNQVALEVLNSLISQYQSALMEVYPLVSNPEMKAALESSANSSSLLTKQLETTVP